VPHGWTRERIGPQSVRWTDGATGAHVQLDTIPWQVKDPVAHWKRFKREVVGKDTLPGFRPVRLVSPYPARGYPTADLEYSWLTKARGRLHALDRGFTANGHQYAILVAAPADRWTDYAGYMDTIFNSFQPAP
jgi:hypothetical protein